MWWPAFLEINVFFGRPVMRGFCAPAQADSDMTQTMVAPDMKHGNSETNNSSIGSCNCDFPHYCRFGDDDSKHRQR